MRGQSGVVAMFYILMGGVGLYTCIQLSKPSKCTLKGCGQHVFRFKRKRAGDKYEFCLIVCMLKCLGEVF